MPKYYCDYCDVFLTHDSPSVRKTHNGGRKHKENVRMFYQKWMEQKAQKLVDATTKAFAAGRPPPMLPGMRPPPIMPGMGMPPMGPGGMRPPFPMFPPGMMPPPPAMIMRPPVFPPGMMPPPQQMQPPPANLQ